MTWLVLAVVLLALGFFVVGGGAGTILLAAGFIALFGAGIRLISRNETAARGAPAPRRSLGGLTGRTQAARARVGRWGGGAPRTTRCTP